VGYTRRQEQEPATEEVAEVAPGVRRVQLPVRLPGLGHVNCYVLEDDRGAVVVDPGLPGPTAWRALARGLGRAGVPLRRVHTVVVTHSHPDHFGAAGRLREQVGAQVVTHRSFRTWWDPSDAGEDASEPVPAEPDDDAIDRARSTRPVGGTTPWGTPGFRPPLSRKLLFALMRRGGGRWFAPPRPSRRVDDADVLELGGREWVALHTPGHTPDHLCLLDPDAGTLLSGDHVLPTITPHISGLGHTADPLSAFFESLDRMADLSGVSLALPAHGHPFDDVPGRVKAIRSHHEERLEALRTACAEHGPADVTELSRHVFSSRAWGPLAESETFAHLEHLRIAGEAVRTRRDDSLVYALR
jgi:glyoxylase-like metal-dependent hydrolase (beta-lactamase superfamily II)